MSDLLARIETQLTTAVAAPRRRTRNWTVGLLATGGAIVVAGGAAAATGIWSPPVGDDARGRPTISATSVPDEQREMLSVLRRPQSVTDRSPVVRQALTFLDSDFVGIRTNDVRVLAPGGARKGVILIPAKRWKSGPTNDALCLYGIDTEGGGVGCFTSDQVRDGQATLIRIRETPEQLRRHEAAVRECARRAPNNGSGGFSCQQPPETSTVVYDGLAPDGVATVQAQSGDTTESAPVSENYFHIAVAEDSPATLRFLDADGREVRR